MHNTAVLQKVKRGSQISALLMVLSAVVVLSSLFMSYSQLRDTQTEVSQLEAKVGQLKNDAIRLQTQNQKLRESTEDMRIEISGLREALSASRYAIIAFHNRNYSTALDYYDQALKADPKNAYLLNLKAYTLFKLKKNTEAIEVQRQSVNVDPNYAWGYFDLARFQCSQDQFEEARSSITKALELRPDLKKKMEDDGEFKRLCKRILKDFNIQ
jgi:tetratricopeptide (TPR) repeat protein